MLKREYYFCWNKRKVSETEIFALGLEGCGEEIQKATENILNQRNCEKQVRET